jgi:hypothetical protein
MPADQPTCAHCAALHTDFGDLTKVIDSIRDVVDKLITVVDTIRKEVRDIEAEVDDHVVRLAKLEEIVNPDPTI